MSYRLATIVAGVCALVIIAFVVVRALPTSSAGQPGSSATPPLTATAPPVAVSVSPIASTAESTPVPNTSSISPSPDTSGPTCTIASMLSDLNEDPASITQGVSLQPAIQSDIKTTYSDRQVLETAEAALRGIAFPALANGDVAMVRLTPSRTLIPGPRPGDSASVETCVVAFYDAKSGTWLMTSVTGAPVTPTPS